MGRRDDLAAALLAPHQGVDVANRVDLDLVGQAGQLLPQRAYHRLLEAGGRRQVGQRLELVKEPLKFSVGHGGLAPNSVGLGELA